MIVSLIFCLILVDLAVTVGTAYPEQHNLVIVNKGKIYFQIQTEAFKNVYLKSPNFRL